MISDYNLISNPNNFFIILLRHAVFKLDGGGGVGVMVADIW